MFIHHLIFENEIPLDKAIPEYKLENQFGELKSISDFKGQYVLVDFWFSGCKPCIDEMKYFPQLLEKYNSQLVILSLSIDDKELTKNLLTDKPKPLSFLQNNNPNWQFQNVSIMSGYVKDLKITDYPTYLLFDQNGKLIGTPNSGIAKVEYQLGGVFDMGLTLKAKKAQFIKFFTLIIPYSIVFGIVFLILKAFRKFKLKQRHL
ncbi:MAG: hypothetical protein BM564_01280 [Bacteroidetes bacterium MedPE-SWsnd-G2]|nr:MAG: hypothetical protein BM564_01280 [Bacteroidetes bacterium MedPE-SWsnd-G2]